MAANTNFMMTEIDSGSSSFIYFVHGNIMQAIYYANLIRGPYY